MARIFGFDIGTTSIGFAVIDHDPANQTGQILRMGVRIFPEARDPDGTPLNQTRRQKRMTRRQLRRRRERRKALNEALTAAGLLPAFSSPDWAPSMSGDPWTLRAKALSEPLAAHELGRSLYHLAQRRHFKGRDLVEQDGAEESAEEKEQAGTRKSTLAQLKSTGQTLGQFIAERPAGERKRGVHANRGSVSTEFERLWAAQAPHHPELREPGFKERISDTIFAQRPVFWRKSTLGKCRFMPDESLCPKGTWLSQQRRMLEKVNNLGLGTGNLRPLDNEERQAILTQLQTQASMTWPGARKALKALYARRGEPGLENRIKFNLELGGEPKLLGNPLEMKLANIFGSSWDGHLQKDAIRAAVHSRLWSADYGEIGSQRVVIQSAAARQERRAAAARSFEVDFGATADQATALGALSLATGWEPYSTTALEIFLPELEKGERFGTLTTSPDRQAWREALFPARDRPTGEFLDRLPSPAVKEERERIATLRNPTVVRGQNELRKVVNNLISMFGKPDLIRVELAREVGMSKREREEMLSGKRKNEKKRGDARRDLESNGIMEPSRDAIEKWMLWKEGMERCPYTSEQICFDALFRRAEYEVEHIWPRSRSLDNAQRNKTLCRKDINIEKGNRTPFEYYQGRPDEWKAVKSRLEGMISIKGGAGYPAGKVKRFLAESMPDDFAARQLVDTGYAARQAVTLLKRLWPDIGPEAPVNVQPVTGRVTAQLRKLWGLNNILADDGEKTRADHRHHAIDALTVACAHGGLTMKLSDYLKAKDDPRAAKPNLPPPWPTIRVDAAAATDAIIVSHRVRKKVSGELHDQMPIGDSGEDFVKRGTTYGKFIKRVAVEKLSLETLKLTDLTTGSRSQKYLVRDETVRKILLAHLEESGKPPEKSYPPYPTVDSGGSEIRSVRVLTLIQRSLGAAVANGFAETTANHHIEIFRLPNGRADFRSVSLWEASHRLARREPIVDRTHPGGAEFVMSLVPGEALEFSTGENSGIRIVEGAWSTGVLVTVPHTDATGAMVWRPSASTIVKENVRKISIDPIGRIRPAND